MYVSWKQGEHVALIGPTGTGKSTLAFHILKCRGYVVAIAVKKRDDTMNLFRRGGYRLLRSWPPEPHMTHVLFWDKPTSLSDDIGKQHHAIHAMLNNIYLSGGWCVYLDEAGYLSGTLALHRDIGVLLNQGRSNKLSVVASVTRPHSMVARVPAETLNQCRHIIIFRFSDEREIKACAEIAGISRNTMMSLQNELAIHEKRNTDFICMSHGDIFIVHQ